MSTLYTIVRCHGLIMHLLRRQEYMDLVEEKIKLEDIEEYKEVRDEYPLERKLELITKKFVDRIRFLANVAGRNISEFYTAFLDFLEAENIKIRIRSLYGRGEEDIYYPYSHFVGVKELKSAKNETDLMLLLRETPYRLKPEVIEFMKRNVAIGEMYIESCYYKRLKEVLSKYKRELKRIIPFVDYEILRRVMYWFVTIGEERAQKLIREHGFHGLTPYEKGWTRIRSDRIIAEFNLDPKQVRELINRKKITDLMHIMRIRELNALRRGVRRAKTSEVFIYYYMQMCREEMSNLYKILIGKENNLPKEAITAMLVIID